MHFNLFLLQIVWFSSSDKREARLSKTIKILEIRKLIETFKNPTFQIVVYKPT